MFVSSEVNHINDRIDVHGCDASGNLINHTGGELVVAVLSVHSYDSELSINFAVQVVDVSAIVLLVNTVRSDELVRNDAPGWGLD
jgi:hypothetical protein